jgi:hypothetical protein
LGLAGLVVRVVWKLFRRIDTASKQITGDRSLGIRSMQERFDAMEDQVRNVDAAFRRHTADGHGSPVSNRRTAHHT